LVNWRDYVSLEKGEYIVVDWKIGAKGKFVLTDRRLIFLEAQIPFIRIKSYEVKKEFPLEDIRHIAYEAKLFSFSPSGTMIYTKDDKHFFEGSVIMFPKFREKVLQQVKERRQELDRNKMPVVIDFSFLKTFIEKGGIVLTASKCPNCSAPIKMPKNGTETVCDHCGSTIYAQDVFEKVKTLID